MTDEQFVEQLENFLGGDHGVKATVPLFYNDDGTVNREKTLSLPCFENFKR